MRHCDNCDCCYLSKFFTFRFPSRRQPRGDYNPHTDAKPVTESNTNFSAHSKPCSDGYALTDTFTDAYTNSYPHSNTIAFSLTFAISLYDAFTNTIPNPDTKEFLNLQWCFSA